MNITTVFTNSPSDNARPVSPRADIVRADQARDEVTRRDSAYRESARTARASSAARAERAERRDDNEPVQDGTPVRERRAPSRAEFASLMAMLSGAGSKVRADLVQQLPAGNASLIDKLLDGSAEGTDELLAEQNSLPGAAIANALGTGLSSSHDATDALRYGILQEHAADSTLGAVDVTSLTGTASAPTSDELRGLARALESIGDRSHAREVLSRIVSRRAASVDQLKALGENDAADVRVALDKLLASAGTPAGLEIASTVENAAMAAAAAAAATALAKANAASAADPTTPIRDTDALAPELQQKLQRVMERMKNEYGHDVTIVETARSQERQDMLFEQGRTRPGNVVTWTRDSAHTRGEAVDVIIDGKWTNAEGFARLQRIAKEEGLRTLGVRDPGHLELAAGDRNARALGAADALGRDASENTSSVTPLISNAARQSGVARVASVAGAAGAAGVAGVAQVATPGAGRGLDRGYSNSIANGSLGAANPAASGPAGANGQGNAFGRGERDEQGRPMNDGRKLGSARRETLGAPESAAFGAMQGTASPTAPTEVAAPAPAAGAASAERVADVQMLRENAPAGQVSRLTLDIDAPGGGQDRITVDLRGSNVGTQITTDAASAERLRLRTAELQDALGRHGLESDSVRISATTRNESHDANRLAIGERDGIRLNAAQQSSAGDNQMNQGQRERSANAREWDRPESSRQSRDDAKDSERQSAGQRGQRGTSNGSAS